MNIQISNLLKNYDQQCVLDIEKLDIIEGSLCGIIGPNGAGKSTLIRILGGLEDSTKGSIYYNGEKMKDDHKRKITVVFQKPYLLRATVFYNIAYPLIIRGENKRNINIKVNKILEEMGLMDLKDKKSWTLSGGEMQKVALARALVFNPSLLMLDEPTANIDPVSISIMEKMIKKIHETKKTTIIMITHNLPQAKRLCNEIIFMYKGRVEEFGGTKEVIFHSKNKITKAFIQGELLI